MTSSHDINRRRDDITLKYAGRKKLNPINDLRFIGGCDHDERYTIEQIKHLLFTIHGLEKDSSEWVKYERIMNNE